MDDLAELLSEFPEILAETHVVLVPAPTDPGSAHVLPRPPIPSCFCKALQRLVPNVTLATNPCRIRYYTQEIVVFRDDITARVRRHCIVKPVDESASESLDETDTVAGVSAAARTFNHLALTLLSQAHLCPLPLRVQPVYWAHDCALRLFPLPDLLILADDYEQCIFKNDDMQCPVVCPGSFVDGDKGNFIMYDAATRSAEPSSVSAALEGSGRRAEDEDDSAATEPSTGSTVRYPVQRYQRAEDAAEAAHSPARRPRSRRYDDHEEDMDETVDPEVFAGDSTSPERDFVTRLTQSGGSASRSPQRRMETVGSATTASKLYDDNDDDDDDQGMEGAGGTSQQRWSESDDEEPTLPVEPIEIDPELMRQVRQEDDEDEAAEPTEGDTMPYDDGELAGHVTPHNE